MTLEKCPGREQLLEVLTGVRSAGVSADIEQHLLSCERCSKQAETLFPAEDITALLAHVSPTPAMPDEAAVVEQLIDQAKRLHAVAQSALPDQTMLEGTAGDRDIHCENRAPALDLSFLQPALADDELGRLGGYRVLQVLGSGGMGIVFRAEDPRLRRQVALKAMKPGIAAQHTAARRFLREAEAIAALEHDHIVTIYQVGEDRGIPFIAMQLLRGESLQQRLDRGDRLDLKEVVRIGSEIASGLQAAHARGLIHRDIKPDNIWLQEGTGRVRILDFGLVQNDGEDLNLTGSGVVLGTPRYMAPEQARGLTVDHRCDLFSLGSVLYRILAGRTPFEGSNLTATLIAVAHEEPRPLQEIAPHVSPELTALVMQLLSKNPAQRLQTATEVLTRLQQLAVPAVHTTSAAVSGDALTVRTSVDPQGTTAVAGERRPATPLTPRFRNWWLAVAAAVFLLGVLLFRFQTNEGTVHLELDGPLDVAQVEVDGETVRFTTDPSGRQISFSFAAGRHQLSLRTSDGLELTTELGSKPFELKAGGATKVRAWLQPKGQLGQAEPARAMAASPSAPARDIAPNSAEADSSQQWTPGPDHPIWNGQQTWLSRGVVLPGLVDRPAELPGAERWNVETVMPRGTIAVLRFSPDNRWLAVGSEDGPVRIFEVATMRLHRLLPGPAGQHAVTDLSWHPDSQRLAVSCDRQSMFRIWSLDGELLYEDEGQYHTLVWMADGAAIVCAGHQLLELREADGARSRVLEEGELSGCDFGNLALVPDTQQVVCWHHDRKVRVWDVQTGASTTLEQTPAAPKYGGRAVQVSRTGRLALTADNEVQVRPLVGGQAQSVPLGNVCCSWYPDGRRLAVWQGLQISVWDVEVAGFVKTSPSDFDKRYGPNPLAMAMSPDGTRIATGGGRLLIGDAESLELLFDSGPAMTMVSDVQCAEDGSYLATASHWYEAGVRCWSPEGRALESISVVQPEHWRGAVLSMQPGGNLIAACDVYGSTVWLGARGGRFETLPVKSVGSIAWNPTGELLALGDADGCVYLFNTNREQVARLETGRVGIVAVAWSRVQGRLIAHAGRELLEVTQDESGWQLKPWRKVSVEPFTISLAWSDDGEMLMVPGGECFSADGELLPDVIESAYLQIWRPDRSEYIVPLASYTQWYSPDGKQLLIHWHAGFTSWGRFRWHPSLPIVYEVFDASQLVARSADDQRVLWNAVLLPEGRSLTFAAGGRLIDGDRGTFEQQCVCYLQGTDRRVQLLPPGEFLRSVGRGMLAAEGNPTPSGPSAGSGE